MQYIEVMGWADFQHYKRREGKAVTRPHFIKNYISLLHKDEYRQLTGHQRGVLHGLWILYAASGCQVALNTRSLTSQLGLRVTTELLQSLSDAGFIRFYSREALAQKREEENIKTFSEIDNPRSLLHLLKTGTEEGM